MHALAALFRLNGFCVTLAVAALQKVLESDLWSCAPDAGNCPIPDNSVSLLQKGVYKTGHIVSYNVHQPQSTPSLDEWCPSADDFVPEDWGPEEGDVKVHDGGWTVIGNARVSTKSSFNMLGGYVEFDIDLAKTKEMITAVVYTIHPIFGHHEYTPSARCAGAEDSVWCYEADMIETNGHCAFQTTLHTVPGHQPGCNADGCQQRTLGGDGWESFHIRADWSEMGAMTIVYGNENGNKTMTGQMQPRPDAESDHVARTYMTQTGAVLQASLSNMWAVPGGQVGDKAPIECMVPWTSDNRNRSRPALDNSSFTVRNLKIKGRLVQGPKPRRCNTHSKGIFHQDHHIAAGTIWLLAVSGFLFCATTLFFCLRLGEDSDARGAGPLLMKPRRSGVHGPVDTVQASWSNSLHKLLTIVAFSFEPIYLATIWSNRAEGWPLYTLLFLFFEVACAFSNTATRLSMWHRQTTRYVRLDSLKPAFPRSKWPKVHLNFTHYLEPIDALKEPFQKALCQDYPADKLVVTILDDGYYQRVNGEYQVTYNGLEMEAMIERVLLSVHGSSKTKDIKVNQNRHVVPPADPAHGRPEAAPAGSLMMEFRIEGLPLVRLVGRMKGEKSYQKTGNLENGLWNVMEEDVPFVALLDCDMTPVPDFLQQMLPPFFQYGQLFAESVAEAPSEGWYPNWRVGFVSSPQSFQNIESIWGAHDPLNMAQKPYFNINSEAVDSDGLVHFWGTNAIFFVPALKDAHGFVYNCITEDTVTGGQVHRFGWASAYIGEALAVGLARENVAETFDQRKRWRTGNMQQWLMEADPPFILHDSFRYPPYREGFRQKLRSLHDRDACGGPVEKLAPEDCGAPARRLRRTLMWNIKRELAYFPVKYAFVLYTPPMLFIIVIYIWLLSGKPPILCSDQGKNDAPMIRAWGIQIVVMHWLINVIDWYLHSARHNYSDSRNASNSVWNTVQEQFGFAWICCLGNIEGLLSAIIGKPIAWNTSGTGGRLRFLEAGPILLVTLSIGVLIPVVALDYIVKMLFDFGIPALPGPLNQSPYQLVAVIIFSTGIMSFLWPVSRCILAEWLHVQQVHMDNCISACVSFICVVILLVAATVLGLTRGKESMFVTEESLGTYA